MNRSSESRAEPSGAPRDRHRQGGPPATGGGVDVLQGRVERVTYHDEGTLYTVLRISPERGFQDPEAPLSILAERISAVGRSPDPVAGARVRLLGRWDRHPEHGRQFRFDHLSTLPPLDRDGLERYLASSAFPGVGPKLAGRIVDTLGEGALRRIREDASVLAGVKGLRAEVRDKLVERVRAELGHQELYAFLLGTGLGPFQAEAVAKKLGSDAEAILRADPFKLASGVTGIGFQTADRVARSLGFGEQSPERLRAALLHGLRNASGDGHCFLPAGRLVEETLRLLGEDTDPDELAGALDSLAREGGVVVEDGLPLRGPSHGDERAVYLPGLYHCESTLAENLGALHAAGPLAALAGADELAAAEIRSDTPLNPEQRAAVLGLLAEPVGLLTGGPGVGKTTIVRLVVDLAEGASARVLLASPTGRAAKRLAEATGREARTVHRLLRFEPRSGRFEHDDRRPLEADLVVVDEASMLDVALAHHLMKAVQPPTRLVLVGDPDQLPSVAAGNVLADLIACGELPVFRLDEVFRQARESLIVENAHRILAGRMPRLPKRDEDADFYFFRAEDDLATAERVVDVVTRRVPKRFDLDWTADVQVLSPMYRGPCGVESLNLRLREALGAGGRELHGQGRVLGVGDRVVHTRNDYEKEVFNGDLGHIVSVAADGSGLTVRYPERDVPYTRGEAADLQAAWAMTVHRSQGGEFPAVVLPLVMSHRMMLQRHLLYTAVTRARRLVVLVGSMQALRTAVENAEPRLRESGLATRLASLGT